jgi:FkbM family methyltransferase
MGTFFQRVGFSSRPASKHSYRRPQASQPPLGLTARFIPAIIIKARTCSRIVLLLLFLLFAFLHFGDLMATLGIADYECSLVASSTPDTIRYFSKHSKEYSNKADFLALQFLLRVACHTQDFNTVESVVLIGGTNEGQSSRNVLDICPAVSLYGFEIQSKHYENAKKTLEALSDNVKVVNLGWDEYARSNVPIGGEGETGGLFDPQGQRGWKLQEDSTANTVALQNWTSSNSIQQVFYLIIDTEGHEPKVIRGMGLDDVQNQQRFPLFQFELGGSWGERDTRHQKDPWSQFTTAEHLAKNGYYLFLMGSKNFLPVEPAFFNENENHFMKDEGYGRWVDGNLLVVHNRFCPSSLMEKIMEHTPTRCSSSGA